MTRPLRVRMQTCWTIGLITLCTMPSMIGCGARAPIASTPAHTASGGSSIADTSSADTVSRGNQAPPPETPSEYGIWVNQTPARLTPVSVQPGAEARFTVDRFDPLSSVDVTGAGIHTTATADDRGRVVFSLSTTDLLPGVHQLRFRGNNGVAVGFSGRIRVDGIPVIGSDYATVLCCFELPADGTSIGDVALRVTINASDLTDFVNPHLDDDGSVLIAIPVPNLTEFTIRVVNTATGENHEETVRTQAP
jgi:hypothetical protein